MKFIFEIKWILILNDRREKKRKSFSFRSFESKLFDGVWRERGCFAKWSKWRNRRPLSNFVERRKIRRDFENDLKSIAFAKTKTILMNRIQSLSFFPLNRHCSLKNRDKTPIVLTTPVSIEAKLKQRNYFSIFLFVEFFFSPSFSTQSTDLYFTAKSYGVSPSSFRGRIGASFAIKLWTNTNTFKTFSIPNEK